MKMYVLDTGVIRLPLETILVGEGVNKDNWIDIPVPTYLIDHPEGLVLFDTACDPEGMDKNWPEEFRKYPYIVEKSGNLLQRLEQLNIAPENIRYVVVSHLHIDHAGCLKYFKNAEIFVSSDEFTRTLRQYVCNEDLGTHMKSDIEGCLLAELSWHPILKDIKELKLLDGLTILNFGPGHTWGLLGMFVELPKSGNFLLASDAIHTREHMGPPIQFPGIPYDKAGYIATVNYIQEYAEKKDAQIIFGHDLAQFKSLKKSTEGYYE